MEKKQKLTELFLLTSFLCLFVVLIHTSSEGVTNLIIGSLKHKAFFMFNKALSFVVPGFIFLSGLKLTYSYKNKKFEFLSFLKKRFTKILIPYTCWYVVYYVFLYHIHFIEAKTIKQHIFSFLIGDLISPFYFITIIFQFYILFGVFLFLLKNVNHILLFIVCAIIQLYYLQNIYPMYEDRFFVTYFIYFLLGCIMAEHMEQFQIKLKKYKWIVYVIFIFFTYWHTTHAYASNVEGIFYAYWRIFTCLFSISGIATFYCISYDIVKIVPQKFIALFSILDASSFYIFLGHCFLLYICNGIWSRIGLESIFTKFILNSMIVFLGSFFVSVVYVLGKKKWYSINRKV
ncbi:acyltransferase [Lachnospiraceae bacterium 46-61]